MLKCVVLFGENFSHVEPSSSNSFPDYDTVLESNSGKFPHLNNLANLGCAGLLVVRPIQNTDNKDLTSQKEVSQLLGIYNECFNTDGTTKNSRKKYTEYSGILAASISNSGSISSFFQNLSIPHTSINNTQAQLFIEPIQKYLESEDIDLVLVHLDANAITTTSNNSTHDKIINGLEVFDTIIGHFFQNQYVYLIVVLGSDNSFTHEVENYFYPKLFSDPNGIIPLQSYTFNNRDKIVDIENFRHFVVAYHHQTTTRRDLTAHLSEREISKNGANGKMLIDHFMHELAFKLGRAAKYGA